MRLLFVGNSLTFVNDLPGMIQRLAAATDEIPAVPEVESVVHGGATLLGHVRTGEAVARIRQGGVEWVVLQEQSTRPINSPALFGVAAAGLAREVRAAGARTLLYLTWARRGRLEDQAALDASFSAVARKTGARIVPVGPAWRLAQARHPELLLHQEDGGHPSVLGTYLAACVFHAVLWGRSPEGLAAMVVPSGDDAPYGTTTLRQEDTAFLQRVAWETVVEWKRPAAHAAQAAAEEADAVELADALVDELSPEEIELELMQEACAFMRLRTPQVRRLVDASTRRNLAAGAVLCTAGEHGPVHFLLDGAVRATFPETARTELWSARRMGRIYALGIRALWGRAYVPQVEATSDVTVLTLERAAVEELAAQDPELRHALGNNPLARAP